MVFKRFKLFHCGVISDDSRSRNSIYQIKKRWILSLLNDRCVNKVIDVIRSPSFRANSKEFVIKKQFYFH